MNGQANQPSSGGGGGNTSLLIVNSNDPRGSNGPFYRNEHEIGQNIPYVDNSGTSWEIIDIAKFGEDWTRVAAHIRQTYSSQEILNAIFTGHGGITGPGGRGKIKLHPDKPAALPGSPSLDSYYDTIKAVSESMVTPSGILEGSVKMGNIILKNCHGSAINAGGVSFHGKAQLAAGKVHLWTIDGAWSTSGVTISYNTPQGFWSGNIKAVKHGKGATRSDAPFQTGNGVGTNKLRGAYKIHPLENGGLNISPYY